MADDPQLAAEAEPEGLCSLEEADEVLRGLHSVTTTQDLIALLEDDVCELLRCEKAAVFKLIRRNKVESLVRWRKGGGEKLSIPVGQGIAGNVAKDNGYYLCNDPGNDPLYLDQIDGSDSITVNNVASCAMSVGEDIVGVLQVWNREGRGWAEDDAYYLQKIAENAALAYDRLQRSEDGWNLVKSLSRALAEAVDNKHLSTVGHAERTRQIALKLGREMGLIDDELLELELAAQLHDIGRVSLSPEAFEMIGGPGSADENYAAEGEQLHVVLTEAVLRDIKFPSFLARVPEIALAHHEKVTGKGFPRGLQRHELSRPARILAIANAFDMLTSGRAAVCKGKRYTDEEACAYLKERAGKDFDAKGVEVLIENKLYQLEKRRYPRYEYEAPLEVTVLGEADGSDPSTKSETFDTVVLELSEGGILFHSGKKLPDHALLKLRIHLPAERIEALARVARHLPEKDGKEGHRVGAYFLWFGSQR